MHTEVRRKPIYNQIAALSILLALALVFVLPFTGDPYWTYNNTLGNYIREHQHEFQHDISLSAALLIFFWPGVIIAGLLLAMLPILYGIFNYYRQPGESLPAMIVLLLCEGLAVAASVTIKIALLQAALKPVLAAAGRG